MKHQLRSQVASILSQILEVSFDPSSNPTRSNFPAWDSLKHFELIVLLEEHFNVRFTAEQVAYVDNMEKIIDIIGEKS